MWIPRTAALAAGLWLPLLTSRAAGQIDHRNLDHERAVGTEDAYPVERHAIELLVSYRAERERGGERLHLLPLELEYGLADNTEVGLGVPLAALDPGAAGNTRWGLAGLDVSGLYNFNTEGPALPAISVAASVRLPVGSLAGARVRVSLKGIQRDEWFYMPGSFNWQFLRTYPTAARLFNAFDYGHAVLYERLYTGRGHAADALDKEYRSLTTDLLVRPPRFAVPEEAVSPAYAKAAWRAKQMFDWAHLLHRQLYDVYADERIAPAAKDPLIEVLTDYYLSRTEYAFAPVPKSMALMDGQYFSRTFRQAYPRFNALIWAYHWLQVGLYEPLIEGRTPAARKAGVQATVARFWSMLAEPRRMPEVMPMTSAIAPAFSARHPRTAAIFDNLHMMHDIISDVLTADTIPHERKRDVIYAQLAELRDSTTNTMSWRDWRMMGDMMGGVGAMGGPATGDARADSAAHGQQENAPEPKPTPSPHWH